MQIDFPSRVNVSSILSGSRGRGAASVANLAAAAINALSGGGGGSGPPAGGPITLQRDYVSSRGKRAYNYTFMKKKKRKMRKLMRIARRKYRRAKRFRRKIRKVISPHYTMIVAYSCGRSWKSAGTSQNLVFEIPILSYRGSSSDAASDGAGAATAGIRKIWHNECATIKGFCDNEVWYPNGSTSNVVQSQWWFRILKSVLDLSMSNTGSASDTAPATTGKVEYEIYYITPRRSLPQATAANNVKDLEDFGDDSEQALGGGSLNPTDPENINWIPYLAPYNKKYFKASLIGRGYLPPGQTTRMRFSYKPKILFNREKWSRDNATDSFGHAYKKGASASILVVARGCPNQGQLTGGYPACRLTVNCNKVHYVRTLNTGQAKMKGLKVLVDSFA